MHQNCDSGKAGHAVLPMQRTVATASPSAWRDGILVASHEGHATIVLIDTDEIVGVWNHAGVDAELGAPVAWHPAAALLAVDGVLISVG